MFSRRLTFGVSEYIQKITCQLEAIIQKKMSVNKYSKFLQPTRKFLVYSNV